MKRVGKTLRIIGLLMAVVLVFAACDLLGDQEGLDTDLNGDDGVVVDDGVTVVTDAEMWEFVQGFFAAFNEFHAQELPDDPTPEVVDASMLEPYFSFPVRVQWPDFLDEPDDLRDFLYDRFQFSMSYDDPEIGYHLESYSATTEPIMMYGPASTYSEGKKIYLTIFFRATDQLGTYYEWWDFEAVVIDQAIKINHIQFVSDPLEGA